VTITYADSAISGASIDGRHEFQRMLEEPETAANPRFKNQLVRSIISESLSWLRNFR
jgi:hypothetical protein